jgi:vacuolar-type H+-ATPase subunit I/STV1
MTEQTTALLRELATKLGTTTEYLWSVMVKGATVNGYINLVEAIFFGLLLLAIGIVAGTIFRRSEDEEVRVASVIAGGLLMVIVGVIFLVTVESAILGIYSPEYVALKDILGRLK